MSKATIHKAITLPCYPHDVEAATAELELTWAADHGDRRKGVRYDFSYDRSKGVPVPCLIITFQEL